MVFWTFFRAITRCEVTTTTSAESVQDGERRGFAPRVFYVSSQVYVKKWINGCQLCSFDGADHYHCSLCNKKFMGRRPLTFFRHVAWHKSGGEERQHQRQYFKKVRKHEVCNVPDCAEGISRTNEHYHCPGCLKLFKRRWQRMDSHASKCVQFGHFLSSSKLTTNHAKGLSETQALVSIVVIPANTKLCHT